MTRTLALLALLPGCGFLIDGVYLLDDGKFTRAVEQRKATGQTERGIEVDPVVRADQTLALECADRTRSIDRAWYVVKEYEYRGGYHQAHWAPIILEGLTAVGLGIGLTIKCTQPDSDLSCSSLYWTVPLGVDVLWSTYRLLTIEKPKLVNKTYGEPTISLSAVPIESTPVSCPEGAELVIGASADDPAALRFPAAPDGTIDAEAQSRALRRVAENRNVMLIGVGPAGARSPAFDRCGYLRAHAAELGDLMTRVSQECPMPTPTAAPREP